MVIAPPRPIPGPCVWSLAPVARRVAVVGGGVENTQLCWTLGVPTLG